MNEQFREEYKTPWDMPADIFWDHGQDAELNRLIWIREQRPDIPMDEALRIMPFRSDTLEQYAARIPEVAPDDPDSELRPKRPRRRRRHIGTAALKHIPTDPS